MQMFIWRSLKTFVFYCCFFFSAFLITILTFFCYFNENVLFALIRFWAKSNLFFLKVLLDLDVEYILDKSHKNNFPRNCLIASEHQSALEILALIAVIDKPVFILKYAIFYIPLIGVVLKRLGMIGVYRTKRNKDWLEKAEKVLNQGKSLIIFPEGTRVDFEKKVPYKKGVFKLAKHMQINIVPVAVNTGLFWPRKSFFKKKGVAKISFGPYIRADSDLLREVYRDLL